MQKKQGFHIKIIQKEIKKIEKVNLTSVSAFRDGYFVRCGCYPVFRCPKTLDAESHV